MPFLSEHMAPMSNHSGDGDGLHEELGWHEFLASAEREQSAPSSL